MFKVKNPLAQAILEKQGFGLRILGVSGNYTIKLSRPAGMSYKRAHSLVQKAIRYATPKNEQHRFLAPLF